MKKSFALCASLCLALVFTGCKSSESAYKKAYEKAKAQDQQEQQVAQQEPQTDAPVVTPLVEKPATQTTTTDNYDNVAVRNENVTVISGDGLQTYSVVVGSFSLKLNAEGLQNTLKSAGYNAQIVFNSERNMYRVVAATFADKGSAVQSRNQFRADSRYKDAWLLYKK